MPGKTPLFQHKTETDRDLRLVCDRCQKQVRRSIGRASFTSWLFHEASCRCGKSARSLSGRNALKLATPSDFPDGDTIDAESLGISDKYELVRFIGEGGMGSVYEVREKSLGQHFALKMLKKELVADQEAVKRFQREAKTTMGLSHENLCTVYGFGQSATGVPYLVMEMVDGESLAAILEREIFLGVSSAVDVFLQICDALSHAHNNQVMHRDLKPSNVIITANARDVFVDQVKVVDFGIAKTFSSSASSETNQLTHTGELVGSPLYMSPEQCRGERLSQQSDIYSLGCVMYEVLTGNTPFNGPNPVMVILQHLNDRPARFNKSLDVPAVLEAIVFKCLEKLPSDRYRTIDELRSDLRAFISGTAPKVAINRRIHRPKGSDSSMVVHVSLLAATLFAFACMTTLLTANLSRQNYSDNSHSWQTVSLSFGSQGARLEFFLNGTAEQNESLIEGLLGVRLDSNFKRAFGGAATVTKEGDLYAIFRDKEKISDVKYGSLKLYADSPISFTREGDQLSDCNGLTISNLPPAISTVYHDLLPMNVSSLRYSNDSSTGRTLVITTTATPTSVFTSGEPIEFTINMDSQDQVRGIVAMLPNPLRFISPAQKQLLPRQLVAEFIKLHPKNEGIEVCIDPKSNSDSSFTTKYSVDKAMIVALKVLQVLENEGQLGNTNLFDSTFPRLESTPERK